MTTVNKWCRQASFDVRIDRLGNLFARQPGTDAQAPLALASVGRVDNAPNSPKTLAGRTELTIDMRHPRVDGQASMEDALHQAVASVAADTEVEVARIMDTPPIDFYPACIAVIEESVRSRGYRYRRILSGAGHDACHLAGVAPRAMIFVPCAGGLSHNEAESSAPDDLATGANVLLDALRHLAERPLVWRLHSEQQSLASVVNSSHHAKPRCVEET